MRECGWLLDLQGRRGHGICCSVGCDLRLSMEMPAVGKMSLCKASAVRHGQLLAGFLQGREAEGGHFLRGLCAFSLLFLWRILDVKLAKVPEIWTSVPCEPSKVSGGFLWRWTGWRVEVIPAIHLFQEMCCQPRTGVTLQLLAGALLTWELLACYMERCACMRGRVYRDGLWVGLSESVVTRERRSDQGARPLALTRVGTSA